MGRAFQVISKYEDRIKEEISAWPDGYCVMMRVKPDGFALFYKRKEEF
ncbi:hypothetical protein [Deferribacter autotrophicus]|nr:hypothetical protein [Deferribacter autotrophicus]